MTHLHFILTNTRNKTDQQSGSFTIFLLRSLSVQTLKCQLQSKAYPVFVLKSNFILNISVYIIIFGKEGIHKIKYSLHFKFIYKIFNIKYTASDHFSIHLKILIPVTSCPSRKAGQMTPSNSLVI